MQSLSHKEPGMSLIRDLNISFLKRSDLLITLDFNETTKNYSYFLAQMRCVF